MVENRCGNCARGNAGWSDMVGTGAARPWEQCGQNDCLDRCAGRIPAPSAANEILNTTTSDSSQVAHAPLPDGTRTPATDEISIIASVDAAGGGETAFARTSRRIGGLPELSGFGTPSRDGRLFTVNGP